MSRRHLKAADVRRPTLTRMLGADARFAANDAPENHVDAPRRRPMSIRGQVALACLKAACRAEAEALGRPTPGQFADLDAIANAEAREIVRNGGPTDAELAASTSAAGCAE